MNDNYMNGYVFGHDMVLKNVINEIREYIEIFDKEPSAEYIIKYCMNALIEGE